MYGLAWDLLGGFLGVGWGFGGVKPSYLPGSSQYTLVKYPLLVERMVTLQLSFRRLKRKDLIPKPGWCILEEHE